MENQQLFQAIARICAQNPRYAPEAFLFVNHGLQHTLKQVQEKEKKSRQITGRELAEGLRVCSLEQFGAMSKTVLKYWGVQTTRDFGEIVFALLQAGVLGKTNEDKIEDFDQVYDFETAFRSPFRPPMPKSRKAKASKTDCK